jgi:hypothetical protein
METKVPQFVAVNLVFVKMIPLLIYVLLKTSLFWLTGSHLKQRILQFKEFKWENITLT